MDAKDIKNVLEGVVDAVDLGSLTVSRVDQQEVSELLRRLQRSASGALVAEELGSRRFSFRKGKPPTKAALKLLITTETRQAPLGATGRCLYVGKRSRTSVRTRLIASAQGTKPRKNTSAPTAS